MNLSGKLCGRCQKSKGFQSFVEVVELLPAGSRWRLSREVKIILISSRLAFFSNKSVPTRLKNL